MYRYVSLKIKFKNGDKKFSFESSQGWWFRVAPVYLILLNCIISVNCCYVKSDMIVIRTIFVLVYKIYLEQCQGRFSHMVNLHIPSCVEEMEDYQLTKGKQKSIFTQSTCVNLIKIEN
jgi:hypothetical protein